MMVSQMPRTRDGRQQLQRCGRRYGREPVLRNYHTFHTFLTFEETTVPSYMAYIRGNAQRYGRYGSSLGQGLYAHLWAEWTGGNFGRIFLDRSGCRRSNVRIPDWAGLPRLAFCTLVRWVSPLPSDSFFRLACASAQGSLKVAKAPSLAILATLATFPKTPAKTRFLKAPKSKVAKVAKWADRSRWRPLACDGVGRPGHVMTVYADLTAQANTPTVRVPDVSMATNRAYAAWVLRRLLSRIPTEGTHPL
jgi:hypothetical protein